MEYKFNKFQHDTENSAIQNLKDLGSPGGELYQLGYEYIKPLGQGGSGAVGLYRLIRQPQRPKASPTTKTYRIGDEVAIKVIDIHERTTKLSTRTGKPPQEVRATVLKYLLKEARITGIINRKIKTCGADADYILNYQALLTTTITSDNQYFYMISEPMAGDLSELKTADLDDKTVMGIICQLIYAVACLHSIGIVHGDLKPSNIFLTKDGSLKLGDFGESAYINMRQSMPAELSLLTGTTPSFSAPENLIGHRSPATKYDLWGLGLLIVNLMNYRPTPSMRSKFKLGDLKKLKQVEINQIIDHLYLYYYFYSEQTIGQTASDNSVDGTLMLRKVLKQLLRIKPNQRVELNKLSKILDLDSIGCSRTTENKQDLKSKDLKSKDLKSKDFGSPVTKSHETIASYLHNKTPYTVPQKVLSKTPQKTSQNAQRDHNNNGSLQTRRIPSQSLIVLERKNGNDNDNSLVNGNGNGNDNGNGNENSLDNNQKQQPFWNWIIDSLQMVAELPPKGIQWLNSKLANK